MENSRLSITEERKMEDNPNTNVEEQRGDEGKALLSCDADKFDRDKFLAEKFGEKRILVENDDGNTIFRAFKKRGRAARTTARGREACPSTTEALDGIMKALTSCDINAIGVLGPESTEIADLLEKVSRRVQRDKLFNVIVRVSVSHKPDNRRIQDEFAEGLGLKFDGEKDVAKRAKRLSERILMEHKVLVILREICKGLDLDKVGIPYGEDYKECKFLLTSASEEVLSKEMHAQKIFKV